MLAALWGHGNGPLWKAWTNLQGGQEAALFCVIVHSYFSPSFCPQMDFIKTSSRWCVKLIWEVRLSLFWTLGQCDVSDFEKHVRHTGSSCLVVTTWFLRSYCSSIRGHCCLLGECLVWNGALWKENKCGRRGKRTRDNHDDDNGDDDDIYIMMKCAFVCVHEKSYLLPPPVTTL